MSRPCNKPLRTNPFVSYRDPKTGIWQVIQCDRPSMLQKRENCPPAWMA